MRVPGFHRQDCADTTCDGCYEAPDQPKRVPTPGPRLNARGETADQARTRRNREAIEAGRHPVTKVALLAGDHTCGECAHAVKVRPGNRSYWKCDTTAMTYGPGTDIRVSWPACIRFEPSS